MKYTNAGSQNTSVITWMLCVTSRSCRKETLMDKPQFVYVTYIAATPEKIWNALIDAEMTTQY